ncbi:MULTISPECIES: hypothetical protein [Methanobacterium]|uniref:AlgX/AlgJ SGNH hydrolase-like domain-containing protein n=1 Tax=Methanobacterium bryantii TaxID=2161 RepID=A0A2A2HA35_METBR|nr:MULTISPECIES: hypothetical protein [Methanobacterium]OEC88530.1 hypothetical protein A9507_04590 [Methanobacterium sp. A39]PAV06292.1 hypothetical protein ASJ80_15805 [Methanobacterium bryantii]
MITFPRYEDLVMANDLEKVGVGKYRATGNDPYFEIRNPSDGLIQDISIELKAENGETIQIFWTYDKNDSFSVALQSTLKLRPGITDVYRFYLGLEKEIKRLRLDPTNASGIIEIKEIGINYLSKEEKAKLTTVPNYDNLKKALKGKNGYLFLINDSNHEIKQHFDLSYPSSFNAYFFKKNLDYNKRVCNDNGIEYHFFIVPDKSLVCKNFLPFEIKAIKRNYDLISKEVPDFIENLDYTCYYKNDTHINYYGGKELVYYYLKCINNNFTREEFEKLINEQLKFNNIFWGGDLVHEDNWSYSDKEKEDYLNEKETMFINKNIVNLSENLPEKFKFDGTRATGYYRNDQSFTNLKVLIFRDSAVDRLKDSFSVYFKEMLLYWDHWDHWLFNKELIEWYKPDIILEIRTERFLEKNMKYQIE